MFHPPCIMCPVHIGGRPLIHGVYSSVNGGCLFSVITPHSLRRVVPPTHIFGYYVFFLMNIIFLMNELLYHSVVMAIGFRRSWDLGIENGCPNFFAIEKKRGNRRTLHSGNALFVRVLRPGPRTPPLFPGRTALRVCMAFLPRHKIDPNVKNCCGRVLFSKFPMTKNYSKLNILVLFC
jgi:hypothetical protein